MLAIAKASLIWMPSMSEAMERIVGALVRLKNRGALEKLRDHRQRLVSDLNRLRSDLNFNASLPLRNMVDDLAEIDAGLEQLSVEPPVAE
jgi:hypothetical protein